MAWFYILCVKKYKKLFHCRKLLFVVEETMSSSANLIERFRETLLQLHDVVRYRSAVPTVQVYPLFIILSHIWEDMQKEVAVLSDTNSYFNYIQSFTKVSNATFPLAGLCTRVLFAARGNHRLRRNFKRTERHRSRSD